MKQSILLIFISSMLLLSGNIYADDTVATVDGKKITQKDLETYAQYKQITTNEKIESLEPVLQELINREILLTQAMKKKYDKNPDIQYVLEQQKRDVYINALLRETAASKKIEESEIQKVYDEKIKSKDMKEYNVRHILLPTENEAKTVIAELDGGAVFTDVAKNKSKGPSAKEGGNLGWVNAAQLQKMPEFAQALVELKKGNYSKKPVQTSFGWHVIKLEDSRKLEPPPYDKIKDQIAAAIRQQYVKDYLLQVRKDAKIDIKASK